MRQFSKRSLGFLSALLCFLSCAEDPDDPRAAVHSPNVVLISIDSLRADHLGCYGYERETSPGINRLASEGVLFTNVISSTSWTLPAHASMFTGLPMSSHGCTGPRRILAPERRTLAESLKEEGYSTAAFWSGPLLHPHFGLNQGFDEYINCASFPFEHSSKDFSRQSHRDVTGPRVVENVGAWLGDAGEEPFFLFIHLWDVHYDYIPPAPYDTLFDPEYDGPIDGRNTVAAAKNIAPRDLEHLVALYDGEIAWTDRHVQAILMLLEERGVYDDTLIVLTADHGEEFFEHAQFGHRKALFGESISVPLILRYPGRLEAGTRLDALVSVVDIAPTILDMVGAPPLPDTMGSSLLPHVDSKAGAPPSVVVSELWREDLSWLAVQSDSWKVLIDRNTERIVGWWDLSEDPGEAVNLVDADTALGPDVLEGVYAMRDDVDRLASLHAGAGAEGTGSLPAGVEESLRSLGYIGENE